MGYKMLTGTGGELPKSGVSTPEEGNNSRLGGPYSLDEILEILGLTKNNNSHQDTQQPSKDDDSLDLYHAYLGNDMAMLSYSSYPYNIHKHQVDEMDFKHKLIQHRLNVQECMAAYYVLIGYKNFDPELVMSALLEGLNPKSIVVCKNQGELVAEMSKKQLDGVLGDIDVYDVASAYSRY